MSRRFCTGLVAWMAVVLSGCGGVKPVTGGTKGTLRIGGQAMSEIQVTVHRVEEGASQPVGFGFTNPEGVFELVTNEARGPLRLEPGEYRFTLESAGAPVQFSKECAIPDATPLKASWGAGQKSLTLDAPESILTR